MRWTASRYRVPGCRWRRWIVVALFPVCGVAHATSYRCVDAGKVSYSNAPCTQGTQTVIDAPSAPNAADRVAADARNKADRAALARLDHDRDRERREDERAAAIAARRNTERSRQGDACAKLALRAKRAHEDYESAAPRDLTTRRQRMRRADDDAALCRKR